MNIVVMIILVAYVQRDVEKRQARVAVSLGLTVTLHISILSKLVHMAAIGCCSLQIHDPSLTPLVSAAVVPIDVEKKTRKGRRVSWLISGLAHPFKIGPLGCDWLLQSPDP